VNRKGKGGIVSDATVSEIQDDLKRIWEEVIVDGREKLENIAIIHRFAADDSFSAESALAALCQTKDADEESSARYLAAVKKRDSANARRTVLLAEHVLASSKYEKLMTAGVGFKILLKTVALTPSVIVDEVTGCDVVSGTRCYKQLFVDGNDYGGQICPEHWSMTQGWEFLRWMGVAVIDDSNMVAAMARLKAEIEVSRCLLRPPQQVMWGLLSPDEASIAAIVESEKAVEGSTDIALLYTTVAMRLAMSGANTPDVVAAEIAKYKLQSSQTAAAKSANPKEARQPRRKPFAPSASTIFRPFPQPPPPAAAAVASTALTVSTAAVKPPLRVVPEVVPDLKELNIFSSEDFPALPPPLPKAQWRNGRK
jgi:hypothetical protein